MTALDLYLQDEDLRASGEPLTDRQAYYTSLRDALHQELTRDGYSDLLEQLVMAYRQRTLTDIYVLDYAALTECHSLMVNNQLLHDAATHIPHLLKRGQRVTWEAVATGSNRIPVNEGMLSQFRQLRTVSRQVHTARGEGFDHDDAAPQEVEQLQSLARMLEGRCKDLENERDALRERIAQLEQGIADARVQRLTQEKRAQAETEMHAAFALNRAAAEDAFRTQYAQQMEERARAQEEDARAAAALRREVADEYAAIRQDVAADVQRLITRLTTQADRWQRAMDRTEYRMLAAVVSSLYPLLTRDLDALAIDAADPRVSPGDVGARIAALQRQGRSHLSRLEAALQRLGMSLILPAPGDAFDGEIHASTAVADGAESTGAIRRCLQPGVIFTATGETLLPAQVETE